MISKVLNFLTQASKSRTIIVNTLVVLVGVAGYLQGNDIIAKYPEVVAALASAVAAVNVVLRFMSVKPVGAKRTRITSK